MTGHELKLIKIRSALADYIASEGCSCCQNVKEHNKAITELARLLDVPKYSDNSGYNFYKFNTINLIINQKPGDRQSNNTLKPGDNMEYLTKSEAAKIVGLELVEKAEKENCECLSNFRDYGTDWEAIAENDIYRVKACYWVSDDDMRLESSDQIDWDTAFVGYQIEEI